MATKKRPRPKKGTYKSKIKEPGKLSWKKPYKKWESSQEELPKRITIENSCWRFE